MTIHLPAALPRRLSCLPEPLSQGRSAASPLAAPIRHCSRWGLPCHRRCRRCGGLFHHRFTLACRQAVCSLRRFPSGCPGRVLSGTVALWSPDFPHGKHPRGHPAIRAIRQLPATRATVNAASQLGMSSTAGTYAAGW